MRSNVWWNKICTWNEWDVDEKVWDWMKVENKRDEKDEEDVCPRNSSVLFLYACLCDHCRVCASAAQLRHRHLSSFLSFYITTTGFPPRLVFRIASVNQEMIPNWRIFWRFLLFSLSFQRYKPFGACLCVCVCLQAEMLSLSCTFVPGSCFFGLSAQHFSKTAKVHLICLSFPKSGFLLRDFSFFLGPFSSGTQFRGYLPLDVSQLPKLY